jgi:hypothetical protein
MDAVRGSGRTTRQMQEAPYRAYYIWVNGYLSYPKNLAAHLGRQDLKIMSPGSINRGRNLLGIPRSRIVIDHATVLDGDTIDFIQYHLHD